MLYITLADTYTALCLRLSLCFCVGLAQNRLRALEIYNAYGATIPILSDLIGAWIFCGCSIKTSSPTSTHFTDC